MILRHIGFPIPQLIDAAYPWQESMGLRLVRGTARLTIIDSEIRAGDINVAASEEESAGSSYGVYTYQLADLEIQDSEIRGGRGGDGGPGDDGSGGNGGPSIALVIVDSSITLDTVQLQPGNGARAAKGVMVVPEKEGIPTQSSLPM